MRLPCPICGDRDIREFTYKGHAVAVNRPGLGADDTDWDDYLHLRDNPAGETRDLWHHVSGCSAWLVVTRNTVSHDVIGAELVSETAK